MMKRIPPFRLEPQPLDEEAARLPLFQWAAPNVGKRHRLGGEPDFLQVSAYPRCKECGETMTFYGQLDSINDEFCIADVGLILVFFCFDCSTVEALVQSY